MSSVNECIIKLSKLSKYYNEHLPIDTDKEKIHANWIKKIDYLLKNECKHGIEGCKCKNNIVEEVSPFELDQFEEQPRPGPKRKSITKDDYNMFLNKIIIFKKEKDGENIIGKIILQNICNKPRECISICVEFWNKNFNRLHNWCVSQELLVSIKDSKFMIGDIVKNNFEFVDAEGKKIQGNRKIKIIKIIPTISPFYSGYIYEFINKKNQTKKVQEESLEATLVEPGPGPVLIPEPEKK